MFRIFLLCCFMFAGLNTTFAADPAPVTAATNEEHPASAETVTEDIIPEAMQHIPKAPDIDFVNLRDPFASYLALLSERGRIILEQRRETMKNREREELENFDLASLKLVAIYTMGEDRVAMIEDSTGKGHTVRRGNYMGQNNGRIEKIDIDTLFLVEQIINAAGEIVDNQVTLTLKEVNE